MVFTNEDGSLITTCHYHAMACQAISWPSQVPCADAVPPLADNFAALTRASCGVVLARLILQEKRRIVKAEGRNN